MLRIKRGFLTAVAATVLLSACASESNAPSDDDEDDEQVEEEIKGKDAGEKDAGKAKDAAAPVKDTSGKDAGKPATTVKGTVPCDIAKIVEAKCLDCHGTEKASGVEFSLTTLADFYQPAPSDETKKIYEVAHTRVNSTTKRMPPASVKALEKADLDKLSKWLESGAPGSEEKCAETTPQGDAGVTVPIESGSGGAHIQPVVYKDKDITCHKFVAFTSGNKSQKYSVPTKPDFYVAFNINPQWTGTQYLKSMKAIIDNKEVIHHWLFFKQGSKGGETVTPNAVGAHPDGELIAGWAPGGDDLYFDEDVGMEVPSNVTYQLEAHYNNKTGSASPDASGVEICVTPNKPAHVAAVSWLGTDNISGTTAEGTCVPTAKEPIHLIAGSPHEHTKGRHMKVVVNRKGGMKEVIHDEPFDFEYQRQYLLDVLINPGDTVTTTCTFSSPATFGKGTSDEMCYFFSTHWPANTLVSTGAGTLVHGVNSCLPPLL